MEKENIKKYEQKYLDCLKNLREAANELFNQNLNIVCKDNSLQEWQKQKIIKKLGFSRVFPTEDFNNVISIHPHKRQDIQDLCITLDTIYHYVYQRDKENKEDYDD